jgi:hypothetical protein
MNNLSFKRDTITKNNSITKLKAMRSKKLLLNSSWVMRMNQFFCLKKHKIVYLRFLNVLVNFDEPEYHSVALTLKTSEH